MAKKKILILVDTIQTLNAGAERQILELSKNINQDQFELMVSCLSKSNRLLEKIEKLGVRTFSFDVKRIYDFYGIAQGLKFTKFLKNENVDILMTYHFGSDIWGAFFGHLAKVPVIISNRRDDGFWRQRAHVLAYKFINRWVKKIIVVSQAVKEVVMKEENVPAAKITVVYNGVDLSRFSQSTDKEAKCEELKLASDSKLIGCVGNVRSVKGHKYLIESAKHIVDEFPEAHFLIIGGQDLKETELRSNLKIRSEDLGIGKHVHFLGIRNDVPELIESMDLCVLPSLSEGLSNTLLEYMAGGKPIIATQVGGNPEVISNENNGLLIKKADSKELTDKMLYLLKNPGEGQRLGNNARSAVEEKFSVEAMVTTYQGILEQCGNNGARVR